MKKQSKLFKINIQKRTTYYVVHNCPEPHTIKKYISKYIQILLKGQSHEIFQTNFTKNVNECPINGSGMCLACPVQGGDMLLHLCDKVVCVDYALVQDCVRKSVRDIRVSWDSPVSRSYFTTVTYKHSSHCYCLKRNTYSIYSYCKLK